jgi:hypothetical protein
MTAALSQLFPTGNDALEHEFTSLAGHINASN